MDSKELKKRIKVLEATVADLNKRIKFFEDERAREEQDLFEYLNKDADDYK